jgi:predicted negative regulator of RcsB-dependent stress response
MSYHEEQETLENVKAWWTRWGNTVTTAVLAAVLAGAAYNGWHWWQRHQTAQAALLYDQALQAVNTADKARLARAASDVEDGYARTPYAPMTALLAAKGLYVSNDRAGAKAQLQWVIDHASDAAYSDIARLRLAGILLDEKAYDAGLALLDHTPQDAFKGLVADRRGDLLAAAGKRDAAREAYRNALIALATADAPQRQLVQFKLDALGG